MDFAGKRTDVVDFGGDVDFTGMQWFRDPPPIRPQMATPQAAAAPYSPSTAVIEQNDSFEFALQSAAEVLEGRFKQYGQLGVLGWCSEFAELIDGLKALGFEGNMFTTTRVQALKTCEQILALKLNIQMQIIVLYLSSQVARLRRFLDSERVWEDYPVSGFPIDPRAY